MASIAVFCLMAAGCGEPSRSLDEVTRAIDRGDAASVEGELQQRLAGEPDDAGWRLQAARAAAATGDLRACSEHLNRIRPPVEPSLSGPLTDLGRALVQAGLLSPAETALRRAVEADPTQLAPHVELAYLLGVEGRCFEAAPHLFESVKRGQFTPHHLVLLGAADPVIDDPALVERALRADPQNPLPRLGQIRTAIRRDDFDEARPLLQEIVRCAADQGEVQGQLGGLLFAMDDPTFRQWSREVPVAAEAHPDIWTARGLWAQANGGSEGAARCFWEALRLDSDHRVALAHLAQTLTALGREAEAGMFRGRAESVRELAQVVDEFYRRPNDLELHRAASRLCEELGRYREARAWVQEASTQGSEPWIPEAMTRLSARAGVSEERVALSENPVLSLDLSGYPLPDWNPRPTGPSPHRPVARLPAMRFSDDAEQAGLNFVYRSRGPEERDEMRMYETTGGGLAALDFDQDGLVDLFLTQGGKLEADRQPEELTDRLFRLEGERFTDVSITSGVIDRAYSQGVAAGDVNNDGFPDLYIGNLGQNRLLLNQGDGTFEDVTKAAGLRGEAWTTSTLIADLNGDGAPDLYDVNYVSHSDAVRATCRRGEELQWCSPESFSAEPDVLWLSDGQGGYRDLSAEAGVDVGNGKGLGIVAADLDGSRRLSLFVANDAVPNFFFENVGAAGGAPKFLETAPQRGLAVDADGLPQACMGVAAGDLNGDQRLDLFVTNFYDESNTAYLQQEVGLFSDETRRCGLRETGLKKLGFGTQCLDIDQDGRLDLVVTNGHVLDLSSKGVPFQMPPQIFWNAGEGRFAEVGDQAGSLFTRPVRGRGLVRLDWNRDGKEDFAASNIDANVSLATNRSPSTGHSVVLRLVGTIGARDAIGATVVVVTAGTETTRQLTAGDGYQCSNERRVSVGIGSQAVAQRVTVRWPSGLVDEWHDVPTDGVVSLVESRGGDRVYVSPGDGE